MSKPVIIKINTVSGLLFFMLCSVSNIYPQSLYRPFELYPEEGNTITFTVDTLTKDKFESLAAHLKEEQQTYQVGEADSSLVFRLKGVTEADSCLYIPTPGKKLRFCNKQGVEYKSGEAHRFLDSKCGFIILESSGYEWWRYFLIDQETNEYFQFRDQPVFMNCDYAYSYGNYYLEGQFTLHDLVNRRKLIIDFYNWMLSNCFRQDNSFYMAFSSNTHSETKYYIRLKFE